VFYLLIKRINYGHLILFWLSSLYSLTCGIYFSTPTSSDHSWKSCVLSILLWSYLPLTLTNYTTRSTNYPSVLARHSQRC